MNQLQNLIAKMDAIEKSILSEATAPTTLVPTHFHKGNLGNNLPLMMTEPGVFWWEGGQQGGEAGNGERIVPWQGNAENRSSWNPASVDGVIENGKYIDFPEGVTWKTYKPAVAPTPAKPEGGAKPTGPNTALTNNTVKKELLAKLQAAVQSLQAAMATPNKAVKEHHLSVARNLMESFGYNAYEGFNDTIQKGGWTPPPVSGADMSPGNTLAKQGDFGSVGKAAAERRAAQEAERLAAQKAASTATTVATNAATPVAKVAQQAGINAGEKAVAGAAKTGALKAGGKMLGKLLPGVGLAFGAKDAYDRYQSGDYLGAGLAGLSGVASLVPGVGTAAALGLDAANLARDYKAGQASSAQGAQATQVPAGGDAKVFALQQKLLAKGAKNIDGTPLVADGKMGQNTQAAMKKYGVTAESLAEGIKTLQERLALIEAKGKIRSNLESEYLWDDEGSVYTIEGEQITDPLTLTVIWESVTEKDTTVQLDEFLGALAKGAWNLGKGAVKGAGNFLGGIGRGAGQVAKGGKNASAAVTQVANKAGGAKGAGLKAGAAMARNPIKTALGATALGAGAGMALPATPSDKPVIDKPVINKPVTDKPVTDKPVGPEQGGMETDLASLIKAVQDAMMPLADYADNGDTEAEQAVTNARVILDMAQKSGSEQVKVDANNAADAKVKASTPPTVTDKPALPPLTKVPAGGPEQSAMPRAEKRTPAEIQASKDLKGMDGVQESSDELARWLKIARG